MKSPRLVVALMLAAVACTGDTFDVAAGVSSPTAVSSTAESAPAPSISQTLTTGPTTVPSTTTSSTDTTAPSTTTTQPTTSTEPANQPVIASEFGALGWWDGSEWVEAADAGEVDLTGDYWLIDLEGMTMATATTQHSFCDIEVGGPAVGPAIDFSDYHVAASWSPIPAAVEMLNPTSQVYLDIVAEHLVGSPGEGTAPSIDQIVRVDLDLNGEDEVIIVTNSLPEGDVLAADGDYSLVLFRTVIDDEAVMTEILASFPDPDNPSPFILVPELVAVADLNGDGISEVVVGSRGYEGAGLSVFQLDNVRASMSRVLSAGCGA